MTATIPEMDSWTHVMDDLREAFGGDATPEDESRTFSDNCAFFSITYATVKVIGWEERYRRSDASHTVNSLMVSEIFGRGTAGLSEWTITFSCSMGTVPVPAIHTLH